MFIQPLSIMQLKPNTLLQGGKYRIVRSLGQGGFGITYEAEQVLLRRKVAVKEFFMKDCCERDDATSRVTVGTGNQRALVERFRGKFIREAQMIAGMDHPHIIRVLDVFEENGTAYYVMDFLPGGSLADKVKKDGPLSEAKAEEYIRQVADALDYIHGQNTVHLDVKPSNILLNAKGEAVLIDFGISKHYDDSGDQTSSTPVGISKGYAPLEQGRDGDISQFKPSTDIYSLGATLYYLVTGIVPPEASIVNEEGLTKPIVVSDRIWNALTRAMQPRRKDRPQDIDSFLSFLDYHIEEERSEDDNDKTIVVTKEEKGYSVHKSSSNSSYTSRIKMPWVWTIVVGLGLVAIGVLFFNHSKSSLLSPNASDKPDSTVITAPVPSTSANDTNNGTGSEKTKNSSTQKTETSNTKKEDNATSSTTKPSDSAIEKKKNEKETSSTSPSSSTKEDNKEITSSKTQSKIRLEQNRYELTAFAGHVFYLACFAEAGKTVHWSSSNPSVLTVKRWSSSNPSVLAVNPTGEFGEITVHSSGTATITASVEGESDSCVCIIHFKSEEKESSTSNSSSTSGSSNRAVSSREVHIHPGESVQLKVSNELVDKWESDNTRIATVNSRGVVKGIRTGNTNVWYYSNGKPHRFLICVE